MRHLRQMFIVTVVLLLVASLGSTAMAEELFSFLPTRSYEGVRYEARPPAETTTILFIGYDHNNDGQMVDLKEGYHYGGQADFLLVVVLDHDTDEIRMLHIDRDTLARVKVTNDQGQSWIKKDWQICMAHSYGVTREENNRNTILAVETLLGIEGQDDGAQIDWYVAMDISGISRLNNVLGGVMVTIPEDMTMVDSAMQEGATITLNDRQAELFCRGRMGINDGTNASRMVRQRIYIESAAKQLVEMVHEDPNTGYKLLDGMGVIYDTHVPSNNAFSFVEYVGTPAGETKDGKWLMTNSHGENIVKELSRVIGYTTQEIDTLPGEHGIIMMSDGKPHAAFYMEENSGLEWALSVLYRIPD